MSQKPRNAAGRAAGAPEMPAVRTTIVGGRPPGCGQPLGPIPRGIEVLLKKAAVDTPFRALLLERRAAAAEDIGLTLEAQERAMLDFVPRAQLEAVIAGTRVDARVRPAFLGKVAAVMLVALGVSTTGCERAVPSRGVRPKAAQTESIAPPAAERRPERLMDVAGLVAQPVPTTPSPSVPMIGVRPEMPTAGAPPDTDRPNPPMVVAGAIPDMVQRPAPQPVDPTPAPGTGALPMVVGGIMAGKPAPTPATPAPQPPAELRAVRGIRMERPAVPAATPAPNAPQEMKVALGIRQERPERLTPVDGIRMERPDQVRPTKGVSPDVPRTEPATEPATELKTELKTEPATEPTPAPAAKPAAEPATETVPQARQEINVVPKVHLDRPVEVKGVYGMRLERPKPVTPADDTPATEPET